MSRCALVVVLAGAMLLGAGCTGAGGKRTSGGSGKSTPERTFQIVRDAMIAGDLPTVFENYSERKQRQEGGLEGFQRKYEQNQNEWRNMFTGSRVTFVAVDKEQATAVVLWGNGERFPPVSFIVIDGQWKIDQ